VDFNALKKVVTSVPILVSLDNTELFCVEANSSDFATGTILSQQLMIDSKSHLFDFFSKSISLVKQNYEIHDKEILAMLAIIYIGRVEVLSGRYYKSS